MRSRQIRRSRTIPDIGGCHMMKVISRTRLRNNTVQIVWTLEWSLGAHGIRQRICFFTKAEAEAAFSSIVTSCGARGIDASALPRTAVVIMLAALSQGREPIAFVPGGSMLKQSVH